MISGLQLNHLSAAEMEFLAGETLITVTSQFDHPEFKFISGDYGPLEAGNVNIIHIQYDNNNCTC